MFCLLKIAVQLSSQSCPIDNKELSCSDGKTFAIPVVGCNFDESGNWPCTRLVTVVPLGNMIGLGFVTGLHWWRNCLSVFLI